MVMLKLVSVSLIKHCISVAGMQTKFLPQKTYSRQIYWQGKIQFSKKNLLSLNLWPQQVDTICVQSPKLQASQNNTKNAKYKIENEKCKIQNTKYRLIQSCGNQTYKQNLPKLLCAIVKAISAF